MRIPKTVKWVIACTLLLIGLQSVYRLLLHAYFSQEDLAGRTFVRVVLQGLRFDARYAAAASLAVLLVSFIPGLHLFKTTAGKVWGLTVYTLSLVGLLLAMVLDAASLLSQGTHIQAAMVGHLMKGRPQATGMLQSLPWVSALVAIGVVGWICFMGMRYLHFVWNKGKSTRHTGIRWYWQAMLALVLLLLVWGRPSTQPISGGQVARMLPGGGTAYTRVLVVNPLEHLWYTLRHKQAPVEKISNRRHVKNVSEAAE